jgi:hypothetical protein
MSDDTFHHVIRWNVHFCGPQRFASSLSFVLEFLKSVSCQPAGLTYETRF